MKLRTDAEIIEGGRLAIFNTEKNKERQKRLAVYGVTPAFLQKGKTLLKNAQLLEDVKGDHYDDRWAVGKQLNADREAILALFKDHVSVARTAFRKDPVVLHTLKIKRLVTNTWGWTQQALHFYTKVEAHASRMAPHGINQEMIAQAKASVEALIAMKDDRTEHKGVAQNSTQQKRLAFKALREWILEFRSIARLAFKETPQLLEVFGIVVSSKA